MQIIDRNGRVTVKLTQAEGRRLRDAAYIAQRAAINETDTEKAAALKSAARVPQKIVLDYVVHHRKKSGTSPKVFKWKAFTLEAGGTIELVRKHAIRRITTRVYYPGAHKVEVMANGKVLGGKSFTLIM